MTIIRLSDKSFVETDASIEEILQGLNRLPTTGTMNSIRIKNTYGRYVVLFVQHIIGLE